jgi:hypothetical protein
VTNKVVPSYRKIQYNNNRGIKLEIEAGFCGMGF